jgi:hypothetical protein
MAIGNTREIHCLLGHKAPKAGYDWLCVKGEADLSIPRGTWSLSLSFCVSFCLVNIILLFFPSQLLLLILE